MKVAEVIGTVTLCRCHPSFRGARLRMVVPLDLENIVEDSPSRADPLVAWDEQGAGLGDRIALAEGPEAAQPFRPEIKPVDAYNAAILDHLDVQLPPPEES